MKFEQLEQLIAIKEFGSISKAAIHLHVAQSTLSASIKSLEDELGTKLITRESKGVSLTASGIEVYTQGQIICEQVYNMKKSIDRTSNNSQILLISNNYSIIGKDVFIDIFNKYHGKECIFKIQETSIMEAIENVSSGISEIGLVRFPEENRELHLRTMRRLGVEYHMIDTKALCVVIGEKNPFFKMEANTIKIEHLANYTFAGYYDEEADIVFEKIFPRNLKVKANISIGTGEHLKELIRKTDAFTFDVYKEKEFNSEWYDGLRYIPINPRVYCEFGWLSKKDVPVSPIAQEYIDTLIEHFRNYWDAMENTEMKEVVGIGGHRN